MTRMTAQPDTAADARETLEAAIRRALAKYTRSPQVNEDVDAILAAADAYRDAPDEEARLREAHALAAALRRDGRPVPLRLAVMDRAYYRHRKAAQRARARVEAGDERAA
jgi:hypothetical protein